MALPLRLSARSWLIVVGSAVISALVLLIGLRNWAAAVFGGIAMALSTFIALRPATMSEQAIAERRKTAQESRSRRLTPSSVEVTPSDLRLGTQRSLETVQRERQNLAVRAYLRMIRDATGFDDVVFWRADAVGSPLEPAAWSSDFTSPPEFTESQRATIDWSADARLIITDGRDPPDLVAGPVGSGTLLYGVLSFVRSSPNVQSSDLAKKWVERGANHLALLVELLEVRTEFQRQRQHSQALLQAAYKIQAHSSTESLGPAICETALEVTSATRSALIKWEGGTMEGTVQSVSNAHPVNAGFPLTEGSLVWQVCTSGMPIAKEDLRTRSLKSWVYGDGEPKRELGSIAIIPLKSEDTVIGAVVIEGDQPGDVVMAEVRHVSLLATVAAQSLQISWKMEEASHRAFTDQLTGLHNRRYFDEALNNVFESYDRYSIAGSLILADLDFFKRVNDTYGHDAGDAVLRHVAAIFLEAKRTLDTCARYGGEEIAILLPHTDSAGAVEMAERLRASLEARPVRYGRHEIPVTASFGVASYPESAARRDAFFPAADKALYRAKADGRNCVRVAPIKVSKKTT